MQHETYHSLLCTAVTSVWQQAFATRRTEEADKVSHLPAPGDNFFDLADIRAEEGEFGRDETGRGAGGKGRGARDM